MWALLSMFISAALSAWAANEAKKRRWVMFGWLVPCAVAQTAVTVLMIADVVS